jgi:chromatin remodeling complex protein RSC6
MSINRHSIAPRFISAELAIFLGRPVGIPVTRLDVTKEINAYIRNNDLQNRENGRIIDANTELKTLFKLEEQEELSYFNIQDHIDPHIGSGGETPIFTARFVCPLIYPDQLDC